MDPRIADRRFLDRVEFVLSRQVDIANQDHHNAMFEFWQICSQPGGGDPDEVAEGDRRRSIAKEALALAFKRSNAFVLNGTVPKDLEFLREGENVTDASAWRGRTPLTPRRAD